MMARILAIAFILSFPAVFIFLVVSQAYPCPFETTLMGHPIRFPTSIGEFQKRHPTVKERYGTDSKSILEDTSRSDCRIQWLFRSTLAQSGADRPLYGVNIFLYGHPEQLDSITIALEKHFRTTLVNIAPMGKNTIYSASLNDCTRLFVSQCDSYESSPAACLRIAISNHLSDKEELYFSNHSYDFEPEID